MAAGALPDDLAWAAARLEVTLQREVEAPATGSPLTQAILRLPAEQRSIEELALSVVDLLGDEDLPVLLRRLEQLREQRLNAGPVGDFSEPRQRHRLPPLIPIGELEEAGPEEVPYLGNGYADPALPGTWCSMSWHSDPRLPLEELPSECARVVEVITALGCREAWVHTQVRKAREAGAQRLRLLSRDGTRFAERNLVEAKYRRGVWRLGQLRAP